MGFVSLLGCNSGEIPGTDYGLGDSSVVADSHVLDSQVEPVAHCTIEGEPIDCGLALLLTHSEIDGVTARDKCESICENGFDQGENGLHGTWCDVACDACISITGLGCETCHLLSDETTDPVCP